MHEVQASTKNAHNALVKVVYIKDSLFYCSVVEDILHIQAWPMLLLSASQQILHF